MSNDNNSALNRTFGPMRPRSAIGSAFTRSHSILSSFRNNRYASAINPLFETQSLRPAAPALGGAQMAAPARSAPASTADPRIERGSARWSDSDDMLLFPDQDCVFGYLRARSRFALSAAVKALRALPVSRFEAAVDKISSLITEQEAFRLCNHLTGSAPVQDIRAHLLERVDAVEAAVHLRAMRHFRYVDALSLSARLRATVPQSAMGEVASQVVELFKDGFNRFDGFVRDHAVAAGITLLAGSLVWVKKYGVASFLKASAILCAVLLAADVTSDFAKQWFALHRDAAASFDPDGNDDASSVVNRFFNASDANSDIGDLSEDDDDDSGGPPAANVRGQPPPRPADSEAHDTGSLLEAAKKAFAARDPLSAPPPIISGIEAQSWTRGAFCIGATALVGRRVPLFAKLCNMRKLNDALCDIYDGAEGAAEALVNLMLRSFGSKRVFRIKRQQGMTASWASEVEQFYRDVSCGAVELTSAITLRYSQLRNQGDAESVRWPRDSPEARLVAKTMDLLIRLAQTYPAQFIPSRTRVEPVGVMLSGEAGQGKTTLLRYLSAHVVRAELGDDAVKDYAKHVFQKGTSQYWEGYQSQLITTIDDAFTKTAAPGETESEGEMIIKMINMWPLSLNMANCQLKGRFNFESRYVFATTNVDTVEPLQKSVNTPSAITRRFPFWCDVRRKPGVEITPGTSPDDIWELRLIQIDVMKKQAGPSPWGFVEPITFSQLARAVHADKVRRDRHQEQLDPAIVAFTLANGMEPQGSVPSKVGGAVACAAVCAAGFVVAKPVRVAIRLAKRAMPAARFALSTIEVIKPKHALMALALFAFMMRTKVLKLLGLRKERHEPQSASDEVLAKLTANMGQVRHNGTTVGMALALDDDTLAMPGHYAEQFKEHGGSFEVRMRSGARIVLTGKEPFKLDRLADAALYKCKTWSKSIRHHIASEPHSPNCMMVRWDSIERCAVNRNGMLTSYSSLKSGPAFYRQLYLHTASNRTGDCGSLIVAQLGGSKPRLYGFHTGGSGTCGSGAFTLLASLFLAPQSSMEEWCGHKVVERVPPVHNGGDSKLDASPTQGLLAPCVTAPAAKRPVGGVDPMIKAVTKLKKDWGEVPDAVELCSRVVVAEIFASLKGPLGPVSRWEACKGIEGQTFADGIARGKSPGYPWVRKYQTKRPMLGSEGEYIKGPAWPELDAACDEMVAAYKRGERAAVFRDQLKDEDRPLEKVAMAKTRLISGCPVEYAVVGREQTLNFSSAFMQARHFHGCMPGLNPMGIEARLLYERMSSRNSGRRIIEGDFEGFDTSQHPRIMESVWAAMVDHLVEHGCDRDILQGLGRDMINARHFGGSCFSSDVVYEVEGTLPSGHFLTAIFNSIYNKVVMRYCWLKHNGDDVRTLTTFHDHVSAIFYGDDFQMSADDANQGFNFQVIKQHARDLGMSLTAADGGDGTGDVGIEETTFICRTYRVDERGGVWMPLAMSSIAGMFDWKKRSTPWLEHLTAVSRSALIELAAHPRSTFEGAAKKIYAACAEHGVVESEFAPPGLPYEYWQAVHRGHVPHWSS